MPCRNDNDETNDEPEPGRSTDGDLPEVSLSLDAILSVLAHHRRRDLLQYLIDSPDQTASIEACVGNLVKREAERTGERPSHDHVEASLYHLHLPKMADAGILDYDPRSREFRYWSHDRLESLLDSIEDYDSIPE